MNSRNIISKNSKIKFTTNFRIKYFYLLFLITIISCSQSLNSNKKEVKKYGIEIKPKHALKLNRFEENYKREYGQNNFNDLKNRLIFKCKSYDNQESLPDFISKNLKNLYTKREFENSNLPSLDHLKSLFSGYTYKNEYKFHTAKLFTLLEQNKKEEGTFFSKFGSIYKRKLENFHNKNDYSCYIDTIIKEINTDIIKHIDKAKNININYKYIFDIFRNMESKTNLKDNEEIPDYETTDKQKNSLKASVFKFICYEKFADHFYPCMNHEWINSNFDKFIEKVNKNSKYLNIVTDEYKLFYTAYEKHRTKLFKKNITETKIKEIASEFFNEYLELLKKQKLEKFSKQIDICDSKDILSTLNYIFKFSSNDDTKRLVEEAIKKLEYKNLELDRNLDKLKDGKNDSIIEYEQARLNSLKNIGYKVIQAISDLSSYKVREDLNKGIKNSDIFKKLNFNSKYKEEYTYRLLKYIYSDDFLILRENHRSEAINYVNSKVSKIFEQWKQLNKTKDKIKSLFDTSEYPISDLFYEHLKGYCETYSNKLKNPLYILLKQNEDKIKVYKNEYKTEDLACYLFRAISDMYDILKNDDNLTSFVIPIKKTYNEKTKKHEFKQFDSFELNNYTNVLEKGNFNKKDIEAILKLCKSKAYDINSLKFYDKPNKNVGKVDSEHYKLIFDYFKDYNFRTQLCSSPFSTEKEIKNVINWIKKRKPEIKTLSDNGIAVITHYFLEYFNNQKTKEAVNEFFDYEANSIDNTKLQTQFTDILKYSEFLPFNTNKYVKNYFSKTTDYIDGKVLLLSSLNNNKNFIESERAQLRDNNLKAVETIDKKKKIQKKLTYLNNSSLKSFEKYKKKKDFKNGSLGKNFDNLISQIDFYLNGYELVSINNLPRFKQISNYNKYFFNFDPNKINYYILACTEDHNGAFHKNRLCLNDHQYGNFFGSLSAFYNLDLTYIKNISELKQKLREIDQIAKITRSKLIISFTGHANSECIEFSSEQKNGKYTGCLYSSDFYNDGNLNNNIFSFIARYGFCIIFDGCSTAKFKENKVYNGQTIDLTEYNYDAPIAAHGANFFGVETIGSCDSVNCDKYIVFPVTQKFGLISKEDCDDIMTNKFIPKSNYKVQVYSSNIPYTNNEYLEGYK